MSGGHKAEFEAMDEFGAKMDTLVNDLRDAGEMVGSCFMDPGLFGIVGQIFGAGASHHCREAGDHLKNYADTLETARGKLDTAKKTYEAQEEEVLKLFSRYLT